MGPEPCDQKSIVILVRAVEWRADELWWEADPRHVENNFRGMWYDFRKSISLATCEIVGGGMATTNHSWEKIWPGTGLLQRRRTSSHKTRSPRCEVRGERALPRHGQADICQLAEDEAVGDLLQRAADGSHRRSSSMLTGSALR